MLKGLTEFVKLTVTDYDKSYKPSLVGVLETP